MCFFLLRSYFLWSPVESGVVFFGWFLKRPKSEVTGIKNRYYPRSTFKHVVAAAVRAGYTVDYHALLDWKQTVMLDIETGKQNLDQASKL